MGNNYLVLISADAEWRSVKSVLCGINTAQTPFGEWFSANIETAAGTRDVVFMHGGWGKISAAASTQFAINYWEPDLLINLGTCGGFQGKIRRGDIILASRTLVYDIYEKMGDYDTHIAHYTTEIDTSWVSGMDQVVRPALLVSADKDLDPQEIEGLNARYGAIAGDWESGAIAWVAKHNQVPVLILRGVTDLVDATGGEAYGDLAMFERQAAEILKRLITILPAVLSAWEGYATK